MYISTEILIILHPGCFYAAGLDEGRAEELHVCLG